MLQGFGYLGLREDMLTPPDEEVLKRRSHLMTYERWTDAESDGA